MATQSLTEHVLLSSLPAEPQLSQDLELAVRSLRAGSDRDVVMDFSLVGDLPSTVVCRLIILKRVLDAFGRQLILCSAGSMVMAVFRRLGLGRLFQFADDESAAVQSLDRGECTYP